MQLRLLITVFIYSLILPFAHAWTPRNQVCNAVLQTPDTDLELLLDGPSASTLLTHLYDVPLLGTAKDTPGLPLGNPRVQAYIRHVEGELKQRHLRLTEDKIHLSITPTHESLIVFGGEEISDQLTSHIKGQIWNELSKIPFNLRKFALMSGRTMRVTLGAITQIPEMTQYQGLIPRGWDKPYDEAPGAGGGHIGGAVINIESLTQNHGSVNMTIHEGFHDIDTGYNVLTGQYLSREPGFLHLWKHTEFLKEDWYERNWPEETLAEFGAQYYHSPQTREWLRDNYLQWHKYFEDLEARFSQ